MRYLRLLTPLPGTNEVTFSIFLQIEGMYKKCHEAIRNDPSAKAKKGPFEGKVKRWNRRKMSSAQRKDRVKQIKVSYLQKLQEEDDD